MKTGKLFLFILLFTCSVSFAQYNDYYNYSRYNNGNNYSTPRKPTVEETEKAKAEQIDKIIANLKAELNLDELQTIAIKNEIASSVKNIDIVAKKETSEEEKSKEIKALTDRTEVVINSYLNAAQKEKYATLIEQSRNGKKNKKAKKKDKTAEE